MAARIFFNVLRAGWGTRAMYSSKLFGAPLLFAADLRLRDFGFFILESLGGIMGHAAASGKSQLAKDWISRTRRRGRGGVCGWSRNSRG
jgi:hypothetical protein